eukprot:7713627-Pyramimonas_sp.AAC.1
MDVYARNRQRSQPETCVEGKVNVSKASCRDFEISSDLQTRVPRKHSNARTRSPTRSPSPSPARVVDVPSSSRMDMDELSGFDQHLQWVLETDDDLLRRQARLEYDEICDGVGSVSYQDRRLRIAIEVCWNLNYWYTVYLNAAQLSTIHFSG